MKKFLLGVMALNAICLGANAEKVTYMYVKTSDGDVKRYDLSNIYMVKYEKQYSDTVNSEAYLGISPGPYQNADYINNAIEVYYRESDTDTDTATVSGKIGNYDYVDLGLPSGLKWATYNVGANKPTGYGDHYRWGDTVPLDSVDYCRWLNTRDEYFKNLNWLEIGPKDSANYYKWKNTIDVKYSIIDKAVTLESSDDAATANWGADWRMPRVDEQQELIDGCFWKWTDNYFNSGVSGYIGTSKTNGNNIFLPATDLVYYSNDTIYEGRYWPCERSSDYGNFSHDYLRFYVDYSPYFSSAYLSDEGHTIRAVSGENSTIHPVTIDSSKVTYSVTISGKVGNHTYVDLGLASGTKWATYNVGASQPTEYGTFFEWGETEPYDDDYKYRNDDDIYTKYILSSTFSIFENIMSASIGEVDSLTTLLPEDDAAIANWGAEWRMPTKAEMEELVDGCDWKWTDNYNCTGLAGQIGVSKVNGNIIFMPATGLGYYGGLRWRGEDGFYWSSSLNDGDDSTDAYEMQFSYWGVDVHTSARYWGDAVRAVVNE